MKLLHFRVMKFRSIVDSGVIKVENDVTCLVGKNEAGKSALLEALYLFNPAYDIAWDIADQYPRWLMAKDRREGDISKATVIEVGFALEDEDVQAVNDVLGPEVIQAQEVIVSETYSRGRKWRSVKYDVDKAIKHVIDQFPASIKSLFDGAPSLESVRDKVSSAVESDELSAEDISTAKTVLSESGLDDRDVWGLLYPILTDRIPKFFRFTNYSTLPGRIDIRELEGLGSDHPADDGLHAAGALLELAGTDPDDLASDDYEGRKAELEAVSIDLTDQVFEYWKQNPNLEVIIDIDKATESRADGHHSVARYIDIRLRDKRTGYSNNFSQRSSGFQWFFSFLAAFGVYDKTNAPIVLLDEPALTLHGKAQADFLRFINERLAPYSPVLYTTHSPFMVEAHRLDRVRIVEDKGPPKGAVVTDRSAVADPDSLFPLQAALGYDIAQNLFIGPNNLVVEGTSEIIYLQVMSRLCADKSLVVLDERWRVLPAGGATNIPTFVSLLGPHLDVTVFADTNAKGMQRIKKMISEGLLDGSRLFLADSVCSVPGADTEDLFEADEYLKYYNTTFNTSHTLDDLPQDSRIVRRLEKKDGDYDHGLVAETFLKDHHTIGVSDQALSNFSTLFEAINGTLAE